MFRCKRCGWVGCQEPVDDECCVCHERAELDRCTPCHDQVGPD